MLFHVESVIELRNRRDPLHAEQCSKRLLNTRPPMQRPPCWKDDAKQDLLDTVFRLKHLILNPVYLIQRPDENERCSHGEDDVFDGAHRIETLCDFVDGAFKVKNPRLPEIDGKFFSQMARHWQEHIKTFRICINYVPPEIADDKDELLVLWTRLNSSGAPVNAYESDLPLKVDFIDQIISPHLKAYGDHAIFFGKKSKRGALEGKMTLLLALAEVDSGAPVSSTTAIIKKFTDQLGATAAERDTNLKRQADKWDKQLLRGFKILQSLEEQNCFHENGELLLARAHYNIEVPFVLARLIKQFARIEEFRVHRRDIAACLRTNLFAKTVTELNVIMACPCRNGAYMKALIRYIDGLLLPFVSEPRLFTKAQIQQKMEEQKSMCGICASEIYDHQTYEGDHVVPWSKGGTTTIENLMVVHRGCNRAKGKD